MAAETVDLLNNTSSIEQERAKATEALEISDDHDLLKPLIPEDWRLPAPGSIVDRIRHLRNAITYGEKYSTGDRKKEKEELAELLKQEEKSKKDIMRDFHCIILH